MGALVNIVRFISVVFSLLISCSFLVLSFIIFLKVGSVAISAISVVFSLVFLFAIKLINYAFAGKASFDLLKVKQDQ